MIHFSSQAIPIKGSNEEKAGVDNYCRRIVATVCTRSFVRANLAVCFNCLRLIGDCNDLLTNFTLNRIVDEFYPTRISIPTDPIPKIGPFLQLPLLFALRGDQRGQQPRRWRHKPSTRFHDDPLRGARELMLQFENT